MNDAERALLEEWQDAPQGLSEDDMMILIDALIAEVGDLQERLAGDDL